MPIKSEQSRTLKEGTKEAVSVAEADMHPSPSGKVYTPWQTELASGTWSINLQQRKQAYIMGKRQSLQ